MSVDWGGSDQRVIQGMSNYERRVYAAINAVADYFAVIVENEAKTDAPWTDRTGLARATLKGFKQEIARDVVAIVLSHGMDYGIFLETMAQGRWAIVLPILQRNYEPIFNMLKSIFS